jgi:hypothetical protein
MLAAFRLWASFAFLLIAAILLAVGRLASSIPSSHHGWRSPDPRFNRRHDLFLVAGLTSGAKSQIPRWLLLAGVLVLGASSAYLDKASRSSQLFAMLGICLVVGAFVVDRFHRPKR